VDNGYLREEEMVEDEEDEVDNEVSETLLKSIAALPKIVVPTKFQVLNYVANAKVLQIRRTGTELQVTDSTGFPLLDVWLKSSCFRRGSSWIMESYGRTVLMLSDMDKGWWHRQRPPAPSPQSTTSNNQQLQEQQHQQQIKSYPAQIGVPSTSIPSTPATKSNSKSTLQVLTPENETLGFFVVGDPFLVQNHERKTIARYVACKDECFYSNEDSKLSTPSSQHPPNIKQNSYAHQNSVSFSAPPARQLYQCLLDGNGQEIGRLETHHIHAQLMQLRFGAATTLAFPLKLLVLASAVRLAAAISSPASSEATKKNVNNDVLKLEVPTNVTASSAQDCCTIV